MAVFAHSSHVESPDPGTKSQGPMRAKILLCYESERKQLNTEYSTEKCPCRRGILATKLPHKRSSEAAAAGSTKGRLEDSDSLPPAVWSA